MVIYLHRNVHTPQRCENMKSNENKWQEFLCSCQEEAGKFQWGNEKECIRKREHRVWLKHKVLRVVD